MIKTLLSIIMATTLLAGCSGMPFKPTATVMVGTGL